MLVASVEAVKGSGFDDCAGGAAGFAEGVLWVN